MKSLATGTNLRQKHHKWYFAPENRAPFPQHLESHRPRGAECAPLSLRDVKAGPEQLFTLHLEARSGRNSMLGFWHD